MSLNVNDIFLQKLNEIQSRVPIKINGFQNDVPFDQLLNNASNNNLGSIDKEGIDRSSDVERAKASRSKSTAVIPRDKTELMKVINTNISAASKKYGIDENLIRAVVKQESDNDPFSLSHTGAQGLMQLMPETADALNVKNPWDIAENIDGGTRYLRDQLVAFKGDTKLALAAYNAGPESVIKYNGVPPYEETQNYVNAVINYYKQYSRSK
jgi:soluble lytic murein transglycosylase-like protein